MTEPAPAPAPTQPSPFAQRVYREAQRRGFDAAGRRVVPGDDAPGSGIWPASSRMRYPRFRARGLCVSSGVVEAGCKRVVGARLKRAGLRWTVAGANAVIALRCCRLSGRFKNFWERRAARAA